VPVIFAPFSLEMEELADKLGKNSKHKISDHQFSGSSVARRGMPVGTVNMRIYTT
jgi:hypothetical protein